MKTLWLHSVKLYLKIGLFFYFKSIKVHGLKYVKVDQPSLILANHQNALIDALLIATEWPRFCHFLTRAAVFKKSIVSKLLGSLNMMPVYRIRDGYSNLSSNNPIFEHCTELLEKGENIVIFPEGSHNLARRVRPLSKGFTRIVFNTLEKHPEIDIQLIPIGFNFIKATEFGDSVVIKIGAAIHANHYQKDIRNEAVVNLKKDVHQALTQLTAHIPEENYNADLKTLESINVDFLDPEQVNKCVSQNFQDCKKSDRKELNGLKSGLKILVILNVFVPYIIWKYIVQPKIDEIEFMSTFRFTIAITLVPIYLLLIGVIIAFSFGLKMAVGYVAIVLILNLLAVKL